jgi:hypothetical protein
MLERAEKEKENIIIPKVITMQNEKNMVMVGAGGELVEKKIKTLLGYVRVRQEEMLPRADRYELSDADYNFWLELVEKGGNINGD